MSEAFPRFIRCVGVALGIDSPEYLEFSQFIGAFQIRRTGVVHLRSRIEEILKDHPFLLDQLKRLCPRGYDDPTPPPDDFQLAIEFVLKVKTRFHGDERHMAFLKLFLAYKNGTMDIVRVQTEIEELFEENRDLLVEFTYFLP